MSEGKVVQAGYAKGELVTANLAKSDLRAIFYLFSTKQDSLVKSFNRPIIIRKDDIQELNDKVIEKLRTHKVEGVTFNSLIAFKNNSMIEFGNITKFNEYDFNESEAIDHIMITWDILLNIDDSCAPIQHTLSVRIQSDISVVQILQAVFTKNQDKITEIEELDAPCIVRVDFINASISNELISLVEEWNKGRRIAIISKPMLNYLKKKSQVISSVSHYFAPFIGIVLYIFIIKYIKNNINDIKQFFQQMMTTLILLVLCIFVLNKIGLILSRLIYKNLQDIGKLPLFQITRGDKKACDLIEDQNIKSRNSILKTLIFEFVVGVLASSVAYFITKGH